MTEAQIERWRELEGLLHHLATNTCSPVTRSLIRAAMRVLAEAKDMEEKLDATHYDGKD